MTLAGGRNMIPIANSDAKCLLENWVEEREVENYDRVDDPTKYRCKVEEKKGGHKGILTTRFGAEMSGSTECRDCYVAHPVDTTGGKGVRQQALERMLYNKLTRDADQLERAPPEPPVYASIYGNDFKVEGFVHEDIPPTMAHNYKKDQPASYWTDHVKNITGTTQIKTLDTPFRKNDAFSTPIEEQWDEAKPYERENIPFM